MPRQATAQPVSTLSSFAVAVLFVGAVLLSTAVTWAAGPTLPTVIVAEPLVREIVEWDEYTGRFQPVEAIEVRSRVSGYLESVHFGEGEFVKRGELLFVIDPRPFEAALAEARAELARARSNLENTEREYDRGKQLGATRALAQELVDARRAARDIAKAEVDAAQARIKAAELELGFTRIAAAIDGRISDARVDVGNLISGGDADSTLLTTIVSLDPIELVIEASEAEFLRHLRMRGQGGPGGKAEAVTQVEARLLDETTWIHRGRVTFIDNRLDPATGTMRVKATFSNSDAILQPGVFARARLQASAPHDAILVPDRAVLSDQDRKILYVIGDDDRLVSRTVSIGPLVDGLRVIRAGLAAGERIVIDGLLRARPGQQVTTEPGSVVAAEAAAAAGPP